MASSSRRAVLTGIGLVTPLGFDPDSFWEALRAGKSGVRPISNFDASALPVRIGGVDVVIGTHRLIASSRLSRRA